MTSAVASAATEQALELPRLLRLIAQRAASDLGRGKLIELLPFTSEEELVRHRRRYEEARRLIIARPLVPLCERPFEPLLARIEDGGPSLDGRDLVAIGDLLRVASQVARRLAEADPACPELALESADLPPTSELERSLANTFDSRGEIREDATPLLAELRGRMRRVRGRIYQQLGSLVEEHRDHLSEETIPMRGGRLVLMLQAGARGRIPGLVHGRSGRGKSFYFEPLDAVESNNQLQQTADEEAAEKRRILAELVRRLVDELPAIRRRAAFVADLDLLQACVRFAEASGARLVDLGGRHELRLVGARHPLLDPTLAELRREALGQPGHSEPIVGLDLELTGERRALVVTGPNAGGKTVALKTTGLLTLAHLCGLPVPADKSSRLPFLHSVVATVGDDQDLLADRSTFSGRLLRLREAWHAAGPDTLVLLDELGSGTDPEEGAALSTALLEGLVERRGLVLITTHLTQLAAAALELDGAFCAAMQFDGDTGRPTFRLLPGPPGGSEALALARRLELPSAWLERAEALLGPEHRDLRRLLAEIERARQELAETQARLEAELDDAARLRRRLAAQETALADERKASAKTLKRELEAFRQQTARRLRDEVERLRAELESGRRRHLAGAAVERLFEAAPRFESATTEEEPAEIEVGGTVRHRRLDWQGTLEKLERGRAQVRVRGKLLHCQEVDLAPAATGDRQAPRPKHRGTARGSSPEPASAAEEPPTELKLIGQRVEPALETLDRFLDRALLASHAVVRIIHGHGSGRLRAAVRKHLRRHPAVGAQRPGHADEGGDGATVVRLRDS